MHDETRLRYILRLATAEVENRNALRAFGHLNSIQFEIEELKETEFWAEHQLIYAEALALNCDPAAEAQFEEALRRIRNLPDRHIELEFRVYENFALYLASCQHCLTAAKQHFESARRLAAELQLTEARDRIELRITRIDLETNKDPRIEAFRCMRRVANEIGATAEEQVVVWVPYFAETEAQRRNLRAARHYGAASDDYFRRLFVRLRQEQGNEIHP